MAMLVAWNAAGRIIATMNFMAKRDEDGEVIGHYDFEAHELNGGSMTDLWEVPKAVASGTWPEHIGGQAHDFEVVRRPGPKGGTHLITEIRHRGSGHRRKRSDIEARIRARHEQQVARARRGEPVRRDSLGRLMVDVTDITGGIGRPIELDAQGREHSLVRRRNDTPDVPFIRTVRERPVTPTRSPGP